MHDKPRKPSLVETIQALDNDILKLLAKRTRMLAKVRNGRKGTDPKAEKTLRQAWETNAARFSRDPRFIRQLFALLQEIEVNVHDESEPRLSFNLAPARRPVDVALDGPACARETRLRLALAAAAQLPCRLDGVLLNDPLIDLVKGLNQSGARAAWDDAGAVMTKEGGSLDFAEKVIYAGEDLLNFHMLTAFALGTTARVKFTGGTGLKMADLTALRHLLPQLGARLTNVVPKTEGLPVRIECSGVLPDGVTIPADLHAEALIALLLAAPTWPRAVTFDLAAHPAAQTVLAEVLPILGDFKATVSVEGTTIAITPGNLSAPGKAALPLDIFTTTALLAMPAFVDGKVRLAGRWPAKHPEAMAAATLLAAAGVELAVEGNAITATRGKGARTTINASTLPVGYAPLALALGALAAHGRTDAVPAPVLPQGIDPTVIEGFLLQLGLEMVPGDVPMLRSVESTPTPSGWASPTPHWSMGLALAAFVRTGLKLSNPGNVTELMPSFWNLYNGLPSPDLSRKPKVAEEDDKPVRRRIIAG